MNSEKAASPAEELLTELIEGLCKYPGDCRIDLDTENQSWPKLTIFPHEADFPTLCGKGGRQIKALQFIGSKMGVQIQLQQGYTGTREPIQPFVRDANFDINGLVQFIRRFCRQLFPKVKEMGISSQHEGDRIRLRLEIPAYDAGAMETLAALEDIIFPYAKRKGGTIKLSPFKQ